MRSDSVITDQDLAASVFTLYYFQAAINLQEERSILCRCIVPKIWMQAERGVQESIKSAVERDVAGCQAAVSPQVGILLQIIPHHEGYHKCQLQQRY